MGVWFGELGCIVSLLIVGGEVGVAVLGSRGRVVASDSFAVALGSSSTRRGFIDPVLGELLVQRVAVDAQAGGRLDLDAVTSLKDLLDQLALDLADDPVV